jgi:hypothetical protein
MVLATLFERPSTLGRAQSIQVVHRDLQGGIEPRIIIGLGPRVQHHAYSPTHRQTQLVQNRSFQETLVLRFEHYKSHIGDKGGKHHSQCDQPCINRQRPCCRYDKYPRLNLIGPASGPANRVTHNAPPNQL